MADALLWVAFVVSAGDKLRSWLVRRLGHGGGGTGGRTRRLWERHGVAGWGLVGPLVLEGASERGPRRRPRGAAAQAGGLARAGATPRTTVLTVAASLGVDALRDLA